MTDTPSPFSPKIPNLQHKWENRYIPEPNSGCWLWIGPVISNHQLYGRFMVNGKYIMAHSWPFYPLPEGYEVHHECRNTLCVNPDHLSVVTKKEHRQLEGRSSETTFWACGHEKTKDNTYIHGPTGYSYCRKCNARRARERRARNT